MLPAFADIDALEARLGEELTGARLQRGQAALDDASALIRAEAGQDWVTDDELDADVPDIVVAVCLSAAKRSLVNPEGAESESIDSYSVSWANSSPDVYLTANERRLVRQAAGGTAGVWTLGTTRLDPNGRSDVVTIADGDEWLPVDPPGELMPFLPADYLR